MATDPPNRIAEIRKQKKLSQQQLAEAIDAHWVTVSKLERGRMQFTWEWAELIAPILKVDPAALFIARPGSKRVFPAELVVDRGELLNIPESRIPEVDIGQGYDDQYGSAWIGINTDAFAPLVPRGSLALLKEVGLNGGKMDIHADRRNYVGHLCVMAPRDWPGDTPIGPLFGLLQFGSKEGYYSLSDGRGLIIEDTRILRLSAVGALVVHPDLTRQLSALFESLENSKPAG